MFIDLVILYICLEVCKRYTSKPDLPSFIVRRTQVLRAINSINKFFLNSYTFFSRHAKQNVINLKKNIRIL